MTLTSGQKLGGVAPGPMRAASLVAVAAAGAGSVGLTLRAGQTAPPLLLALFVLWVLSPFVGLAWANMVSHRWSVITRATVWCVSLVIALISLAVYGGVVLPPAGSPHAFVYVIVPPGSWLLLAIAVAAAALVSRRRSHRGADV